MEYLPKVNTDKLRNQNLTAENGIRQSYNAEKS